MVYPTESKVEIENVASYMRTKFFRFLVEIFKDSINTNSQNFKFIPLQDFSRPWNDRELYEKYGLTLEEQQYIEANISAYED